LGLWCPPPLSSAVDSGSSGHIGEYRIGGEIENNLARTRALFSGEREKKKRGRNPIPNT